MVPGARVYGLAGAAFVREATPTWKRAKTIFPQAATQ
jgi:hypothetical protein